MNRELLKERLSEIAASGWPTKTPRVSGVYALVHKQTGKAYIGSSGNIQQRLTIHKSVMRQGGHQNKGVSSDVVASGYEAFGAGLLIECPIDELIVKEHQIINLLEVQERYNTIILNEQQAAAQAGRCRAPTVRVHVFFTEQIIAQLQERSAQTGLTVSDLIRRAIEQFLKKEAK